jgi:pimeloyl-ACP methyl ester carboxylesterase
VTSKTAHLPRRSVRYLEAGAGQPFLLIHAFPLHAEQWLPQLARPPRNWRLIAPDLRGFGPQGGPSSDEPMSMDSYADDLVELLAHLNVRRAVVGGLSLGGYVALALVRKIADRVAGLVLADTRASADSAEGRANRDRTLEVLRRDGVAAVVDGMLPKLLGETSHREQPDLGDAVRHLASVNSSAGVAAAIRAMRDRPDSTTSLDQITCPTLVMCGAEDALTPLSDAESMRDRVPGARLVVIPRAGHLSNLEQPAAFNASLWGEERFLRGDR